MKCDEINSRRISSRQPPQQRMANDLTPYIIIGAGPAGLMAAEILAKAGRPVVIYDRMRSPARKFLMAGRGGLNLTHSEPLDVFLTRYGATQEHMAAVIKEFTPDDLRAWCEGLGQPTFVGSSGRVFPKSMKASPLLRAWIARLEKLGVTIKTQRTWTGWNNQDDLTFTTPNGEIETVKSAATLLALGGASWPKLGSDGQWVEILKSRGVDIAPLRPSNCGFIIQWSDHFQKFAGQPLKSIALTFENKTVPGEMMITKNGIEGGAIYALSGSLRDRIEKDGRATLMLDLRPGLTYDALLKKLQIPQGRLSFSSYLKKNLNLPPVAITLFREIDRDVHQYAPEKLAAFIKALPLRLTAPFSIDRAISTAGGVSFDDINDDFSLKNMPNVFVAGEMLDWEASTGGYLLKGVFATAYAAAQGMLKNIS